MNNRKKAELQALYVIMLPYTLEETKEAVGEIAALLQTDEDGAVDFVEKIKAKYIKK